MKKRILGIVLAIAMIAALLPTFTLTATAKPGDFFIRTSDVDRSLEGRTPGLVVTADKAETPVSTSYTSGEVTIEALKPGDTLAYGVTFKSSWPAFQEVISEKLLFAVSSTMTEYFQMVMCGNIPHPWNTATLNENWVEGKAYDGTIFRVLRIDVYNGDKCMIYLVPELALGGDGDYGYGVFVNNGTELIPITSENKGNVLPGGDNDGKILYDSDNKILTLKGAAIKAEEIAIMSWLPDLTINLIGENTITVMPEGDVVYNNDKYRSTVAGIAAPFGNLKITDEDDGSLVMNISLENVEAYQYDPVGHPNEYVDVDISGALINIWGSDASGKLTIENTKLKVPESQKRQYFDADGNKVSSEEDGGTAWGNYVSGLHADNDIVITGSQLPIAARYDGIYSEAGNITITCSQLNITSDDSGIRCFAGRLTVTDSQVMTQGDYGIECVYLTVNGDKTKVRGIGAEEDGYGLLLRDENHSAGVIPSLTATDGEMEFTGEQGICIETNETDPTKVYSLNGMSMFGGTVYNSFTGVDEAAALELDSDHYLSKVGEDDAVSVRILFTSWGRLNNAMQGKEVPENDYFTVDDTTTPGTRIITLSQDITAGACDSALIVPAGKTVVLNLNGKVVDRGLSEETAVAGGYVMTVNGNLTVNDDSDPSTGKITGGNNSEFTGGVRVNAGGELTLTGGSICDNKTASSTGGVFVYSGAKFTMTGGSITGNTAGNTNSAGGVTNQGTFIMTGGEITENTAAEAGGVKNTGAMTVGGTAKITGNTVYTGGFAPNLETKAELTLDDLAEGAGIGIFSVDSEGKWVSAAHPIAFATGTKEDLQYFTSDREGVALYYEDDKLIQGDAATYFALQELLDNAADEATVTLRWNFTAAQSDFEKLAALGLNSLTLRGDKRKVTLDLNGFTLNANELGRVLTLTDGTTLTVKDGSNPSTGKIIGGKADGNDGEFEKINGGAFYVAPGCELKLQGGTVSGSEAKDNGGAVYVQEGARFTLDGGTLSGNGAANGGGAVYVRGTFKFYSGEIAGNSAKRGAGVYVYNANNEMPGSLYMEGGSVKNNTASDKGGGIYADNLSAVSLFDGEISGNTALTFGGGVCCNTAITVGGDIQVKNNTSGAVGRKVTDNVYLRTTGKADYSPLINISTSLTQEASIGVGSDTAAPVTISDSCDDVTDCFTADDPGEQIVYEDGVLKLAKVPDKCKYEQQVETPVDGGTYRLTLNGREQGWFEFAEKDGGWSIRIAEEEDQANGKEKRPDYLAAKDGKLILSDEPYFWTYDRKTGFSTAQIVATQIPGFWFLFWHIPASTTVTSATCYLNTTQDGEKLAVCPVCTGLYQKMAAPEHECEWVDCGDGQHKRVCVHCETEFECEGHDFGEDGVCTRCGAKECDLTVTYSQTRQTVYGWFWTRYTVYTVKINVTGSDRESVTKVEFSLDGGKTWHAGRTITSNAEIGSLLVRVTDKHGARVFELPESK